MKCFSSSQFRYHLCCGESLHIPKSPRIICRVDTSAYDQRVENRKKAEKLKKDMDAVIKQMDVTKKYEMYEAENPELAALLDQYKELTK